MIRQRAEHSKFNWTEYSVQYLINNYKTLGCTAIAKHLGITYKAVQNKARRLGITGRPGLSPNQQPSNKVKQPTKTKSELLSKKWI